MIKGLGNDIIEVQRVKGAIERHGTRFVERLFTGAEREYCQQHQDPFLRYAGRYAAKEAIAKALGTGFREGVSWKDMEILNDSYGKPYVVFSHAFIEAFGPCTVLISISHCKEYASAVALWIDDRKKNE